MTGQDNAACGSSGLLSLNLKKPIIFSGVTWP